MFYAFRFAALVFEKLLAMENFLVFKKIMIKRNTQLQFEAMQCYMAQFEMAGSGSGSLSSATAELPAPDEMVHYLLVITVKIKFFL